MTADTYAGDLSPQESWNVLVTENNSFLIDVRTDAEYSFVGITDLSTLNKKTIYLILQGPLYGIDEHVFFLFLVEYLLQDIKLHLFQMNLLV